MLELIEQFLEQTGIHADTFGRLVCNNSRLVWAMRDGHQLDDEVRDCIIDFIEDYGEAKK